MHDFSPYCVSIALMDEDELTAGVIYEVTRDELFYAWRGSYAYLNGRASGFRRPTNSKTR